MTTAQALAEMLANWTKTEAAVRAAYPAADDEQVYQITAAAMNKSLSA